MVVRMANVNIYLPDALAEAVRVADLNVSAIARAALQQAIERSADQWTNEEITFPFIAATPGWFIRFVTYKPSDGEKDRSQRVPIAAWDARGRALVADDPQGLVTPEVYRLELGFEQWYIEPDES
jgi:hypothetical protein